MKFECIAGSPGTPSSSPPASASTVMPTLSLSRHGTSFGKLPDENSNMAVSVDRHADSLSPASMDSSIHQDSADERAAKSKCRCFTFGKINVRFVYTAAVLLGTLSKAFHSIKDSFVRPPLCQVQRKEKIPSTKEPAFFWPSLSLSLA